MSETEAVALESGAKRFFRRAKNILYLTTILVIAPVYFYLEMPVLNFFFKSFSVGILFITLIVSLLEASLFKRTTSWAFRISATLLVLSILHLLIMSVVSWAGFRTEAYRALIGEVKVGESFAKDIAPISLEKIRIVDQDVAARLGDKVLGEMSALGSQVEIGTFNIQKVKDELYWVAPLLHAGFFKWAQNRGGTPAYVMVSATNERDVRLVNNLNGQPVRIQYQPNAFFGSNLYRHIYFSGYMTTGLTDFTFEIDDNGHPYWVVTLYTNKIGFSGENAYGVLVVDATTGAMEAYNPDNAPLWVDRIQPKEMVKDQLDYWGEYVNGYWNFANQDKLTTTDGISLVFGHDHRSYWYTGLTSVGRDQGTVGFVLVDTRTKKATWYKQSGATEEAAMLSAVGKVQEKGYQSSFPILYNINGVPTYVMSLKDKAGLIKMIALVSVEDYSIVGVGNSLKEAVRAYKDAYNGSSKGNSNVLITPTTQAFSHLGQVRRIASDVTGGNTYYYIYLDNLPNKVFIASSTVSPELPLTQIGDSVQVKYEDGRTETIDLTSFDNRALELQFTDKANLAE